jgi:hypothetical protein
MRAQPEEDLLDDMLSGAGRGGSINESARMTHRIMIGGEGGGGGGYNGPRHGRSYYGKGISSFLNFLNNPSYVRTNLRPDEKGMVTVKNFDPSKYSTLLIVATNLHNAVTQVIPLSQNPMKSRDLRHSSQMSADFKQSYAISRESNNFMKGKSLIIEDITSTQFEIVDSVSKLFGLFKELKNLTKNNSRREFQKDLDLWDFFRSWPSFGTKKKL